MAIKMRDLQELETEELRERAEELRAKLFELRSRQARKELEGGLEIRITRRGLARVLTLVTQRLQKS